MSEFLEELLGIQFFGEFLIDRWIINQAQLIEALEYQIKRNRRFGDIAVSKGYLSAEQAQEVARRQRETDQGFGQLAISLGFLTQEQAREIIAFQRDNNVFLGEVLLRLGYVTEPLLERELSHFREHQSQYTPGTVAIPEGVKGGLIMSRCVELTHKLFRRVAGMSVKVGRGILLRHTVDIPAVSGYFVSAQLNVHADVDVSYALSVTRDVALAIASGVMMDDASAEPDDILADAVMEFCNLVCGNAAAKLSQSGLDVEIEAPLRVNGVPRCQDGYVVVAFPLRTVHGGADLRFFVPPAPNRET